MKLPLLAFTAMALVIGCTNTGTESSSAPAATTASAKKAPPTAQSFAHSRLPDKAVKLSMPIAFKSQQLAVSKDGSVRSLLAVRYYKTAAGELWSKLDQSFAAAGYTMSALPADHKNHERHAYKKAGKHTMTISAAPDQVPEAKGTLWIGWHVAKLARPAKLTQPKPATK